ncbi:uncharacterized protein JN550_007674 [Neoarthrinium moseri]|uniref:uncharacterized protein n=1 Tax=Neoarthrinium moseri TaxID=1658444 RepID=UPI001FDAF8D6|nr:uncharacterized protein JN550_007674 [Neoarthrinium moseri]KAI1866286.1 hypothetical protein JN550_007674 [Neoarthrinium moseri]
MPNYTNRDHVQIDFIKSLLYRAPNLNSTQLVQRTQTVYGPYVSRAVTTWLFEHMGRFTQSYEDIQWTKSQRYPSGDHETTVQDEAASGSGEGGAGRDEKLEEPSAQSTQVLEEDNEQLSTGGFKVIAPSVRRTLRNTPWGW